MSGNRADSFGIFIWFFMEFPFLSYLFITAYNPIFPCEMNLLLWNNVKNDSHIRKDMRDLFSSFDKFHFSIREIWHLSNIRECWKSFEVVWKTLGEAWFLGTAKTFQEILSGFSKFRTLIANIGNSRRPACTPKLFIQFLYEIVCVCRLIFTTCSDLVVMSSLRLFHFYQTLTVSVGATNWRYQLALQVDDGVNFSRSMQFYWCDWIFSTNEVIAVDSLYVSQKHHGNEPLKPYWL